jgi:hypothetical protein
LSNKKSILPKSRKLHAVKKAMFSEGARKKTTDCCVIEGSLPVMKM